MEGQNHRRKLVVLRSVVICIFLLLTTLLLRSVLWATSYEFASRVATHVSPPRKFSVPVLAEKVRTPTGCIRYVNVTVKGKQLEKCIPETPRGSQSSIFYTVKTGRSYHKTRIMTILLTWLQTVHPEQVHIVTDKLSYNEDLFRVAAQIGLHVRKTKCGNTHHRNALCCKTGIQYHDYYETVEKNPNNTYRWFCHFDDDIYVNIPLLVESLESHMDNSTSGEVYFGRWPRDVIKDNERIKNGVNISKKAFETFGINRTEMLVRWASGAAYCFSASMMDKLKPILRKHVYKDICNKLGVNDDMVPAVLSAGLGCNVSEESTVNFQYDQLNRIPHSELQNQITISYELETGNLINISNPLFSVEEDPYRFLSYHCLLYPSTSWCNRSSRT